MAADSKAKFLQEAERYVLQGRVPQAIGEYLKIVKLDPDDVLTLNTIGDLYLRQNNVSEANKYFSRVAESYVRNNFFLKAIAVYKKILNADPHNLEINLTMASLYAKQGLSIDAKNQYLKVAGALEREGRSKEILDIYVKVVELDPTNAVVQGKLAGLYLAEGSQKNAHHHYAAAARAQMKAGDYAGATDSFRRAIQLEPVDPDTLSSYMDCCQQMGNIAPAFDRLQQSIQLAPENLSLREMLGQAHLAAGNLDSAIKALEVVFSIDESRYEGFFPAIQLFIERDEHDRAISCLDTIVPALITRRETERAAQLYTQILQRQPNNILAQTKLASIYSATGDNPRYLGTLERIADHYMNAGSYAEALGYLEQIIQILPESDKHRNLHRQAFMQAYPDSPYVPPAQATGMQAADDPISAPIAPPEPNGDSPSEIVEIDLLLNYGLKEKALGLLQSLEMRDPASKEARFRLMNLFKGDGNYVEAARQCLLLAALCRLSGEENASQEYLAEARQLVPKMAEHERNLEEYARQNGIDPGSVTRSSANVTPLRQETEVDLSSDLMDIFFTNNQGGELGDESPMQRAVDELPDGVGEEFPLSLPRPGSKSAEEQLQEVDFYIRLGFYDEATAKLNEIAKSNPDNPELESRYQKLHDAGNTTPPEPGVFEKPDESTDRPSSPIDVSANTDLQEPWKFDDSQTGFAMIDPEQAKPAPDTAATDPFARLDFGADWGISPPRIERVVPIEADKSDFQANEMFADLMENSGPETNEEISAETFENHFSLGTAYREMDLMDESIREFQNALKIADAQKDCPRMVQCCGMLSTCFLKKGMPRSALRWCQTGLSITDNSSHEALALRYDMGVALAMSGSREQALTCFDRIFHLDPSYRDVAQRIDELRSGSNRHAP